MAVTDLSTARVIRSTTPNQVDRHAFSPITELPALQVERPGRSGDPNLDAVHSAAWQEGFAEGKEAGEAEGHAAGYDRGLEEGKAEGHEQGYRDGLAAAERDAFATVQARFASAVEALEAAAAEIADHDRLVLADMEAAIVDLGLSVAQAILDREVAAATDPGREALQRALAIAPDHDTYLARLNPDDFASIGEATDLAPGRSLELAADPAVAPGGCVLEAGAARIDAQIDTALARVREVLQS